jgi:nicotine blue oxidoreductase
MPLTSRPLVRGLVLAAGAGRRMGGPKALLPAPGGGTLVEAAISVMLEGGCDGVTVVVGAEGDAVRAVVEAMPESGDIDVVECAGWDEGMGASLRAGLRGIRDGSERAETGKEVNGRVSDIEPGDLYDTENGLGVGDANGLGVDAVLVTLVDLPDVTPAVVQRLLAPSVEHLHPAPPPNAVFGAERGGTPLSSPSSTEFEDGTREVRWRRELRRAAYGGRPGHPALIGRDFWDETIATAIGDRGARELYSTHPHQLVECGDLATGRDVDTREEAASWGLPSGNRGRE